ncbi:MAG: ribonuclease PH [Candidatus Aminicenantes bacterium]|nr:ribonuclease PH [Candidatus Aminicenantes bacterium]
MREDGRENSQLRDMKFVPGYIDNVPGSLLIEQGNTKIICSATIENRVPFFLKESGKGWIAAEYSMLPGSTGNRRNAREREKKNNRNIEIQRFIGRALRNTFDLNLIRGMTIFIDTDVIRADGSTRCAALNSGMIALAKSLRYLVYENLVADLPEMEVISAVSIGVKDQEILVDLTFEEDAVVDADINIVSSEKGNLIEVQAFAEENPVAKELFHKAIDLGIEKNLEIMKLLKKQMGV